MQYYESRVGRPVFNLQTFLKGISKINDKVYPVVPDGIFGDDTKRSVESFQFAFGLPVTGEVDSDTWALIVEEHKKYIEFLEPVNGLNIITNDKVIYFGEENEAMLIIQAMMLSVSKLFTNISAVEITGVYDEKTRVTVVQIKEIFEHDGEEIDKKFINELVDLYEHTVVFKSDFYPVIETENAEGQMSGSDSSVTDTKSEAEESENEDDEPNEKAEEKNESENDRQDNVIVWKFF